MESFAPENITVWGQLFPDWKPAKHRGGGRFHHPHKNICRGMERYAITGFCCLAKCEPLLQPRQSSCEKGAPTSSETHEEARRISSMEAFCHLAQHHAKKGLHQLPLCPTNRVQHLATPDARRGPYQLPLFCEQQFSPHGKIRRKQGAHTSFLFCPKCNFPISSARHAQASQNGRHQDPKNNCMTHKYALMHQP